MRFWLLVFLLMVGFWVYYTLKPRITSTGRKMAERMHKNLREELKGTEWEMKDGRVGKFHDVTSNGQIFILVMPDGSTARASYIDLTRRERTSGSRAEDIVTEIR